MHVNAFSFEISSVSLLAFSPSHAIHSGTGAAKGKISQRQSVLRRSTLGRFCLEFCVLLAELALLGLHAGRLFMQHTKASHNLLAAKIGIVVSLEIPADKADLVASDFRLGFVPRLVSH